MDIQSVVEELRREVRNIEAAITALVGLGQTAPRRGRPPKSAQAASTPVVVTSKRGPRKMSAAARARISAAQKARWAKQKGRSSAKQTKSVAKKTSGRKGMSAAARKRLSEMMKARWAARKKA